jgi:hypothetical protein
MHRLLRRFTAMRCGIAPIGVQRALRCGDQMDNGIIAGAVLPPGSPVSTMKRRLITRTLSHEL